VGSQLCRRSLSGTIFASAFLVPFNLVGLPYRGAYDNFLIVVSLIFNSATIWYAWRL
jgi:hypothetical protein